ncbi:outer membrane protein assembly factor BamB family protein [Gemmata sp.]|uniref:outer membrane protein assembly factor BamB family protein n=1 Tax=Gemmata sp. TaxID=1914242 RepID=UPI003F6F8E4B
MRRIALVLLFTACGAAGAADHETDKLANWHQWRGPHADGSAPSANPPVKWDATTNVRWKAEVPGKGSSTPVVWGDRVFVTTAVKMDRVAKPDELPAADPKFKLVPPPPTNFYKFLVLCFDRNTGKVLWEKVAAERLPHEGTHETHSYAGGSPTTDGKHLYLSFGSAGTFCYDFDGNLKWARDLGIMHTRLGWGEAVTPVVAGGALLVNYDQEVDSALYCLDAATGKDRWVAKRDEKTTWNVPLVVEFGGKTQVVTSGTTRIRSYDLATGDLIWQCGGMTVNPIPSPVRVGDAVVCMSGYKGSAVVSVPLGSTGDLGTDGKVNWRYGTGTPYVPSPAVVGSRLYFTGGNGEVLTVLDAKTGKPVIEQERLPQAKSFYGSPATAAGRVYFTDRSGVTVVLKAGDTLDVLSVNKLGEPVDASPVLVGKQLFLRGERALFCIEER